MASLTLSLAETAQALGMSERGVRNAVARGDIPTIRIGGRVMVPRSKLEDMVNAATPSRRAPDGASA